MTVTLDQFANLGLSAAQKTKLQQLADIGQAIRNVGIAGATPTGTTTPNISLVTLGQAKTAEAFLRDVNTLLGPMVEGARYVRQKLTNDAATALDNASPASTF